ncbi:hypothetical protein BH09MYX1_BH09MYX1_24950 [soil metagenome]
MIPLAFALLSVVTASAATASDGTFEMTLDSPTLSVCVAIPDGKLAAGCDPAAADRVTEMNKQVPSGGKFFFAASLEGEGVRGLVVVAKNGADGEMRDKDLRTLEAKWKMADPTAVAHERRFAGVQVVDLIAYPSMEDCVRGYLATYMLAGKNASYVVTITGPGDHGAELTTLADNALATLKLTPAVPLSAPVTVTETHSTVTMVVGIVLGVGILVVLGLVVRAVTRQDEAPPPASDRGPKKKKRRGRGR